MTPPAPRPAYLLDHEDLCPKCHGEKRVELSGVHPSRPVGGVTAMEEPDTWTEECDACQGVGVVINERRARKRDEAGELMTRLINRITASRDDWKAQADARELTLAHQQQHIDQLIAENRRLRDAITKAARLIETRAIQPQPETH